MAIVAVQDFRRDEPKKDKFDDALSKIAAGLKIAQSIYGFKASTQLAELNKVKLEREQNLLAQEKAKTGLEVAGIIEPSEANKEFRLADDATIENIQKQVSIPLEVVNLKIADPSVKEGFITRKGISREDLKAARAEIAENIKTTRLAQKTTDQPAQKADATFAKEYSKYISQGEEAKMNNTINKLQLLIDDAEKNLSRGLDEQIMGALPDTVRDIVDSEDKAIEDRLKSEAQKSLRQTLGAQFTEKEGKMILDRAYNPAQPKRENMRRMRELLTTIKEQAFAKQAAMRHFGAKGTIAGFKGPDTGNILTGIQPMRSDISIPGEPTAIGGAAKDPGSVIDAFLRKNQGR